jgi:hypothetical protein
MAVAATGLDYHTEGGKTSTGSKMRQLSGDTSGGTNSDEIKRAWDRGYDEIASIKDGDPWADVRSALDNGRGVMLQVWAATVGAPLCCTTGVGHGIYLNPESRQKDGATEWLVSDPWCKPPKWVWVRESRLRAGAEKWASKMAAGAASRGIPTPFLGSEPTPEWHELVRLFFRLYGDPANPPTIEPPDGATGPANGVLFALTKIVKDGDTPAPVPEGGDVSINTNGSDIYSARVVHIVEGQNFYSDAALKNKQGEFGKDNDVPYIGPALGDNSPGVAVIANTKTGYSDGVARPTIVYINPENTADPKPNPTPKCPPATDCDAAVAARDEEWREWLMEGAPGT